MDPTVPEAQDATRDTLPSDASVLVSVVTVCLNDHAHIAETIESVLGQGYPHVEYVVVDGGSTDGTLDVIRDYEPRFAGRMRWISQPDEGIYDAMNAGLRMCRGELVGTLNSGDLYLPGAIAAIVAAHASRPDAGLLYGDAEIIDEAGTVLRTERAASCSAGDRPDHMPMCHQSLFVTRATYETLGLYDAGFQILADYDFVLRALDAGVPTVRVETPIARSREGGVSSTQMRLSNRERERIRVAHGASPFAEKTRRWRHTVNQAVHDAMTGKRSTGR